MAWDLADVDPACKTGTGNQCGIHIHEGTSCTKDAEGHFWNETLVEMDPWSAVQYNITDGPMKSKESIRVFTGLEFDEIVGRAVVVHDSLGSGQRIACALIKELLPPTGPVLPKDVMSKQYFVVFIIVSVAVVLAAIAYFLWYRKGKA